MQLLPLQTRRISPGEDLVSALLEAIKENQELGIRNQDIVVISSKAVTTAEGRIVDLRTMNISKKARELSPLCDRSPAFCQAVLDEVRFRHGEVRGTCPGAILTELRPWNKHAAQHDMSGTIFAANAGLDESNIGKEFAVGWPEDPVASVRKLRIELGKKIQKKQKTQKNQKIHSSAASTASASSVSSPHIAIILSDSCLAPRRMGVTAYALAVAGMDPCMDVTGRADLFAKPLRITMEAIADQLATAANFLMGNAAQSVPAVIIRDHGLSLSNFEGWVPGIGHGEDIFRELLIEGSRRFR